MPFKTCLGNSIPPIQVRGLASYESKDQGTQTEVELPETESYFHWSGRGRSPFKTPATAAIDGLRKSAKLVEWVERETVKERIELEKVIRFKKYCFAGIAKARFEVVQDRMDPMINVTVLAQPDIDQFKGRSNSPDKYIAKMKVSTPPVHYHYMEAYENPLPKEMDGLLRLLEGNLGEGSIPSTYEVIQIMTLRDRIDADLAHSLRYRNPNPTDFAPPPALHSVPWKLALKPASKSSMTKPANW